MNKLVHQSLRHVGLTDDALLIVLTNGATQLVVVHGGSVLSEAPQSRHVSRVFDFKNACRETRGRFLKQSLIRSQVKSDLLV